MLNIWETVRSDAIILLMRLCGSDEKYITGKASDFECFRELLRVLTFAEGHVVSCGLVHKLSELLCEEMTFFTLCRSDAKELWKRCNAALRDSDSKWSSDDKKYNNTNKACAKISVPKNKIKIFDIPSLDIANEDTIDTLYDKVEKQRDLQENIHISLPFSTDGFTRPDRYHAELELKRAKNGEKCNLTAILCQIVFELIYKNKREKIHIHIDSGSDLSAARAFIEYLRIRKLAARVYLTLTHEYDTAELVSVCALGSGELLITPELADSRYVSDGYLDALARVYPIGLLGVVI